MGWYDVDTFNVTEYHKLSKLDEGDMNWIIPGKLVALSSPAINVSEGLRIAFFKPIFKRHNVRAVIRLNERLYNDLDLTKVDIRIYPLEI